MGILPDPRIGDDSWHLMKVYAICLEVENEMDMEIGLSHCL